VIIYETLQKGQDTSPIDFGVLNDYEILQTRHSFRQDRDFYYGENVFERLRAAAAPFKYGTHRLRVDPMLVHETGEL
jgi:hypothetical protein